MADKDDKDDKDEKKRAKADEADEADEAETSEDEAKASAKADDEGDDGEDDGEEADRVDDIAKRVDALGEEDELDKIARAEEEKLAERRKKRGKKGGLQTAASKRLAGIGKRDVKRPTAEAVAAGSDDPLMAQTRKLSAWARDNQRTVTIAGLVAVAAALGFAGYMYNERKTEQNASVELAKAVSAERGRIGDPDKEDDENAPKDPRPVFKTAEDRRTKALEGYRGVKDKFPKTGAAIMARLAEGSILLDKKDADGAAAAFNDVKGSPLAAADSEVKGRALEGAGFAYELKAQANAGEAARFLDEAYKVYQELEHLDVKGFKELGMYHQARVLQAKGDKDKAKELLKTVRERVNKPGESHPFPYLEEVATDRLRALDPSAVPPKMPGAMGGPGGNKMTEAQIRDLIEKLKAGGPAGGGGGGGDPHGH